MIVKPSRQSKRPSSHASRRTRRTEHGVPRENILQLLPDAVAPSKEQLAAYRRKSHKAALKYLGSRPLKLVRHTHGLTFYHRGQLPPIPGSVHQLKIEKREGGEGIRVWVHNLDGLLGLLEMDAVELHPWAATVEDIEHPDRLVFDLDPGPDTEWDFMVETALALRAILEDEGHESWPKLTGGKGLHLLVPIEPSISHDEAREYCRGIAERIARDGTQAIYDLARSKAAHRPHLHRLSAKRPWEHRSRWLFTARPFRISNRGAGHLARCRARYQAGLLFNRAAPQINGRAI
jgi:bifunctional non-homologous end joining protein LigD